MYKVNFQEIPPEVAMRKSNLITESMILEGEDPFEDFMNKRLKDSGSSGRKSEDSSNGRDSDFGNLSEIEETNQASYSFKKQERYSDLTKEANLDQLGSLEIIPEEKTVGLM